MRPNSSALPLVLLLGLSAPGCVVVDEIGACRHREPREATVAAQPGIGSVEVRALAGSLAIVGRTDVTAVRVEGEACTRHRRHLDDVELAARAEGDRIVVEAVISEAAQRRGARLDLRIEVPAAHHLVVMDTSGGVEITGVASAEIDDGSGDLRVSGIAGDLAVSDRSGEVEIRDAAGAVTIEDRSGDVLVSGAGSVEIVDDGSGHLEIHQVAGDVVVRDDGSGDIEVSVIAGDLRIDDAGSGDVDHRDVRGRVEIDERRRGRVRVSRDR